MDRRDALKLLVAMPAVDRIASVPLKSKKDIIVLEAPGFISDETAKRIKEYAEKCFPDHKVMVLGDGLRVKVLEGKE